MDTSPPATVATAPVPAGSPPPTSGVLVPGGWDRRRLPQSDGADCAIGAQQQGELAGRAPCGLVLGVLLAGRSECGAARGVAAVVLAAAWIASVISLQSGSPPLSCRESIHTGCPRSASASRNSRTKPSSALLWERKSWTIGGDCRVGARVTGLGTKRGPQFGAGLCFAPMTLT